MSKGNVVDLAQLVMLTSPFMHVYGLPWVRVWGLTDITSQMLTSRKKIAHSQHAIILNTAL